MKPTLSSTKKMGTGYILVNINITGTIEEDIGTNNYQKFLKKLELLCLEYRLDIEVNNA